MLNYQSADRFFEHCLVEIGLLDGWTQRATLTQFTEDEKARVALIKSLHDIQSGADATYNKGKPNEDAEAAQNQTEWERRWNAWAASRKAAFYSRAALFMLGESQHFDYFVNTLRTSHNIVFQGAASDVLQHVTKQYLNGSDEDLNRTQLADWWEKYQAGWKR